MFTETIVFRILNFLLGDYVEGLTRNSLKISVLGASLRMQNVGIRGDALHRFNLPVRVDSGRVCDLSAKVVSPPSSSPSASRGSPSRRRPSRPSPQRRTAAPAS